MTQAERAAAPAWQSGIGLAVALLALLLAWGSWQLPPAEAADAAAGGARWVPMLCAAVLLLCGLWLLWEARHGGWRHLPIDAHAPQAQLTPWVRVSAGLLLAALLVPYSGFVVAAALCYVLALQGLKRAAQPAWRLQGKQLLVDGVVGLAVAAAVYGLFTQALGVALPAGWLSWM